ncbi:MAG: DUF533 domain-containing protein [Planctomycetaceae bacterium]
MDAMDILGGLLRQRSGAAGSASLGGQILKSIVAGGRQSQSPPRDTAPGPQIPPGRPRIVDAPSESQHSQLDGLEDMLRQAHSRQPTAGSREPAARPSVPQTPASRQPMPQHPGHQAQPPLSGAKYSPNFPSAYDECTLNQKSELIVQAMISAAKADGQIDQSEQDRIVRQMGELTQDDVEYLRREFARPLNLHEFVWSVPLGAEQEIYAVSMMTLNLDSRAEINYLKDLAHGLRMSPQLCAQIHQRFGVPVLQ